MSWYVMICMDNVTDNVVIFSRIDLQVRQLHQNLGCWMFHLGVFKVKTVQKPESFKTELFQTFHASSCFKMVAPSLVMVTSPISSTNILSNPWGPRDVFRMLAKALQKTRRRCHNARLPWTSLNRDPRPSRPSRWPTAHLRHFLAGLKQNPFEMKIRFPNYNFEYNVESYTKCRFFANSLMVFLSLFLSY